MDLVRKYIEENNLNTSSRQRDKVYKRFYLAAYLNINGYTQEDIAKFFNKKEHSTISYAINMHRVLTEVEDEEYIMRTEALRYLFPIKGDIKPRRTRSKRLNISICSEAFTYLIDLKRSGKIQNMDACIEKVILNHKKIFE